MEIRPSQTCQRCIMDTTDDAILFDEKGNCNHCENFIQVLSNDSYIAGQSEENWKSILATIKERGKGKPYDCC